MQSLQLRQHLHQHAGPFDDPVLFFRRQGDSARFSTALYRPPRPERCCSQVAPAVAPRAVAPVAARKQATPMLGVAAAALAATVLTFGSVEAAFAGEDGSCFQSGCLVADLLCS